MSATLAGPIICAFLMVAVTARADVFSNVPSAAEYAVAYELDIPLNGAFQGVTAVPYTVNNSATAAPGGFDRVAYYLELTNASGTTWVYTSMDAFTTSVTQTGLPHAVNNPVTFQQSVNNLEVYSNVSGVQTGSFDRGQIEMWHHTYTTANAQGVYAASATTDDWGDTIGGTASGYGSFQIHNPAGKQVILAYNRWASTTATNDDVGIGNSTGTHPDWTLAANTATYTSRKLVVLVRPKLFNVTLSAFPKIQQVTPRNVSTNLATVPVSGTETIGGYDKAVLKILRNGAPYGTDTEQALTYVSGGASFSFNPQIPAELASYTVELYLKQGATLRLVRSVRDMTAGDVYLWYGQSNGEARKFSGSASAYSSPWVRTFGMNSDLANFTQASTFWTQADGDAYMEFPAGIGQWPLVVGRKIVDTYGIPVAILNGSRAAYNITQLQRDDTNPDNLSDTGTTTYRVYNRLRYRAIQAKVADKIRGIFFYQGESDEDNAGQHAGGFASLIADWQVDYPAVEKIFVSQVHVGCPTSAPVTRELPELRNLQRLFADVYPKVRIMSTNGLTTHTDSCHFPFTGGYETHGLNVFRQVQRELHAAPDAPAIDPPNPANVDIISGNRLRINLRKANAGITVDSDALADFRINGSPAVLSSAAVTSTAIELQYDRALTGATSLDYLAHIGSTPGWVRNSNGVGLLAFSENIIPEPPPVTVVAPTGVVEVPPGTQYPLNATATAAIGTVARIEILIDGVLHTADNSAAVSGVWTVPATGPHQVLFRATNSAGDVAESSLLVLVGATTAPGGVANGLNVWLRPESGIIRDATNNVSSWQDSSGNNNHCSQTTASARPLFTLNQFGPLPGVYFNGDDWLSASSGMSTGSYTKIVRVRMPDFTSPSGNILSSATTVTTGTRHALYTAGTALPRMWHKGDFATSATVMTASTGYIMVATYDSSNKTGTLFLNGAQVGTGTATANTNDSTYQLGNLSSGNFTMRGTIGEAIIYNRVLTPGERGSVESYLAAKALAPLPAPLISYTAWSALNVPEGEDSTPNGDFNGNGIRNAVEFALALQPPWSPPGTHLPSLLISSGGLDIRYSRPTNLTGVSYQLFESPDLAEWQPVTDFAGPAAGGHEERYYSRPIGAVKRAFYRLQVAIPDFPAPP